MAADYVFFLIFFCNSEIFSKSGRRVNRIIIEAATTTDTPQGRPGVAIYHLWIQKNNSIPAETSWAQKRSLLGNRRRSSAGRDL